MLLLALLTNVCFVNSTILVQHCWLSVLAVVTPALVYILCLRLWWSFYSTSLWGNLITGALRHGTHCQWTPQFTCYRRVYPWLERNVPAFVRHFKDVACPLISHSLLPLPIFAPILTVRVSVEVLDSLVKASVSKGQLSEVEYICLVHLNTFNTLDTCYCHHNFPSVRLSIMLVDHTLTARDIEIQFELQDTLTSEDFLDCHSELYSKYVVTAIR